MRDRFSTSSDDVMEMGQIAMKTLIQKPVKEAVREAIAEEREARTTTGGGMESEESDSADGGRGLLSRRTILPILGIVGALAIARRRSDRLDNVESPTDLFGAGEGEEEMASQATEAVGRSEGEESGDVEEMSPT
jgi:hypothetical protein